MLKFPKLLPKKVYRVRDKFTLPYDEKGQLKGYLLTVLGENIDDTTEFFKRPYWQFRRYNRYYLERKVAEIIASINIKIPNDQQEMFQNGFGQAFPNTRLMITPEVCRDFNTIYELNQYMELVHTNRRISTRSVIQQKELKVNLLVDKLETISRKFPNQSNKFLLIPVDKYIENTRNAAIWTKRSYRYVFLIQLIKTIEENPSLFNKLSDWTFVFSNINEVFYIPCSEIDSDSYELIKELFKKFKSRPSFVDLQDTDDDSLGDTEDENEEKLTSTNRNTLLKAASDIVQTINSLPIEPDVQEKLKVSTIRDMKIKYKETTEKPVTLTSPIKPPKKVNTDLSKIKITEPEEIIDDLKNSTKTSDNKLLSKTDLKTDAQKKIKIELNKTILPPQQSVQRLARIEKIQKQVKDIKVDNTTIEQLAIKAKKKQIEKNQIKADVINENMKNIPFNNFEKGYNKNLLDYDLTNILTSFSEKDRPLYLISLEKEDNSTTIDKIYTYKAVFEDEKGARHNLTFDMPKFVNEKFIHINGSDKLFINQIIPLPVTKVSPDEVQISSNYNKIFIRRFGKNVSTKISRFHKIVPELTSTVFKYTKGNNIQENISFMTTIEYDELGSKYSTITLVDDDITIYFNQPEIRSIVDNYDLEFDDDVEMPFAIKEKSDGSRSLICLDTNKDTIVGTEQSPVDFIISLISNKLPKFEDEFSKLSVGRNICIRGPQ